MMNRVHNDLRIPAAIIGMGIFVLTMMSPQATAAPLGTWDAQKNFSRSADQAGPWKYGFATEVGGYFNLARTHLVSHGLDIWQAKPEMAQVEHNGTSQPITVGNETWQPGDLTLHCGHNGAVAVLHFVVPSAGEYSFHVLFKGGDPNAHAVCAIVVDNRIIQSVSWNPSKYPDDDVTNEFDTQSEKFYQGETIEFEVGGHYRSGDVGLSVTVQQD